MQILVILFLPLGMMRKMTNEKLKETLHIRVRVLENKLMKSIPAARNNEIRGEIMGLKWVLEKLYNE